MRRLAPFSLAIGAVAAILLSSAGPALAALGVWSPPVSLSTAGSDAFRPQLVTHGTTITAVWQGYDGSATVIRSASSIDDGTTWSTPVTLSETGGNASEQQLASDGTTLTAIWKRADASGDRIQSASSTDDGATWSTPVTVSDAGAGAYGYGPQLVTDGTTLTAIWYLFDGTVYIIQSASSTDDGTTWSTPVALSDTASNSGEPHLVTTGTTLTAIWSRSESGVSRIESASSTDDGTTWSTPVALSDTGGYASDPHLTLDGTTVTAVWQRFDGSHDRIQTASSTDGGTTWTTPFDLSAAGGDAAESDIAGGNGRVTAIWTRFDGTNNRVQTASSTDRGSTWSPPVTLSEAGEPAGAPRVVTDDDGLSAAWNRFDANNGRVQTASSTDGGSTWSPTVNLSDDGGFWPQLATDGTTLTVVWCRFDGTNYRVEASSFSREPDEETSPELAETGAVEPTIAASTAAGAVLVASGLAMLASGRMRKRAASSTATGVLRG